MTPHHLETLESGRYHCVVCDQTWKFQPESECPGVKVYRWGEWPKHLLTKKQMNDAGFQTGQKLPAPGGVVFRKESPDGKMWLYDQGQGVPKRQVNPDQKAQLQQRVKQIQTDWNCTRCGDRLKYYVKGGGLCFICRDHKLAEEWARMELERPDTWLILDTETTGLRSGHHEIVQLAVIDGTGTVLLNTFIQPQHPERMFQASGDGVSAHAIHGITADNLAAAPTFPQVYEQLKALVDGKHVFIYNLAYDSAMLDGDCERHDLPMLDQAQWECAMEWYAQWVGEWSYWFKDYKWQPLNGGHDALGDCQAVLRCIKEMAKVETAEPAE